MMTRPLWSSTMLFVMMSAFSQTSTGKATSPGACSIANSGAVTGVTIKCGIGAKQGKQMLAILNKILANQEQLPANIVLEKLDEILKNLNPNAAVITYTCEGSRREESPGESVFDGGEKEEDLRQLLSLLYDGQFQKVLSLCTSDIASTPQWLTPYLACGLAYMEVGDNVDARRMMEFVDKRTGPGYAAGACKRMSDILHNGLGPAR